MGKVVYLTGAPASGKSSTTRLLREGDPELLVWEYGARLTEHINGRSVGIVHQDQLRERSASVVTAADIEDVDRALLEFVATHRSTHNIIIDSHPVTKEAFGFRITPFSLEQFRRLAPDEIWLLYVSPKVTIERIANDPAGRPTVSEEDARLHTSLQASVAATYGISIGRAVHLFDGAGDRSELIARLQKRLA
ncbi:ATP-binding protein [Phenylobacterium sp.]|uniref:ATP-binding protein n=1 Tax=Phenylobacterium sp. TaxID=1871053 RepID=UPI002736F537|nr:ATP-binding protein [Phenylobacterium sp.]MDP3634931.1 ATP-binding protein [Phenylobacterium sp.]